MFSNIAEADKQLAMSRIALLEEQLTEMKRQTVQLESVAASLRELKQAIVTLPRDLSQGLR